MKVEVRISGLGNRIASIRIARLEELVRQRNVPAPAVVIAQPDAELLDVPPAPRDLRIAQHLGSLPFLGMVGPAKRQAHQRVIPENISRRSARPLHHTQG